MKITADRETVLRSLLKLGIRVVGNTEDFDGSEGGIWLSAEEPENEYYFDYYAMGRTYELGVRNSFREHLESMGWFAEWHDPGTMMLWRI